jgi:hypothetical protein
MTLSPKARFQKSADAKTVSSYLHSDPFLNAVTAALAEMQMNMPGTDNPSKEWDSQCQMAGAKRFIDTLLNITEQSRQAPPLPKQNLQPIN